MGVLSHVREKDIEAPNMLDMLDKYKDAHINDSG
jgi:hypothetical protein